MSLVSLERALEQLAREFAMHVIADVVRAHLSEVRATLRDEAVLSPAAFPIDVVARSVRPPPSAAQRRGDSTPPAPPLPAPDDEPEPSELITDPALLLDVIASAPRSSPPPPPRAATLVEVSNRPSGTDPLLRPGERLQRTAGGSVVLRRGGS